MQARLLVSSVLCSFLLAACGGGSSNSPRTTPQVTIFNSNGSPVTGIITASFDPSNSVVPFPTNLLLSGTTDLTLNIPVPNPNDASNPKVALNALDGFGTLSPWSTRFSVAPNPATLLAGKTIRLFEVTLSGPGGGVTKVVRELQSPQEFVVALSASDASQRTLAIVPTKPLTQLTSYMAVLLGDGGTGLVPAARLPSIADAAGNDITADTTYFLAKRISPICVNGKSTDALLADAQACGLEPLRQLVNSQEAAAQAVGVDRGRIVLSWVATTQSVTVALSAVNSIVDGSPAPVTQLASTGLDLSKINSSLPPIANVYVGILQVPYYLNVPTVSNPTAPLGGSWKAAPGAYVPPLNAVGLDPTSTHITFANPIPVKNTTLALPVLMTVPNANSGHSKPTAGWPIVIFQHGITRNRTDMFAIAGTLASQGYAAVAIDLPLHGITDPTNPFFHNQLLSGSPAAALITAERTFDLDFSNNTTGAAGPDNKIDSSGSYFINLTSLLTSRDNLRQGVADLLSLRRALATMNISGGTSDFDTSRVSYVGQSLGSIVGTDFMAVAQTPNTYVQNAVLNVPGGGIANFLVASPAFGPRIIAGLGQVGVHPGTSDFDTFLAVTQTVIDSSDPINFAFATANKNLLLQEVVGDGANGLPDQVIPNSVIHAPIPGTSLFITAPLSGTEPLISALGLTPLTAPGMQSATGIRGVVRFTKGDHGSILDPTSSPATTVEMQTEMLSFLVSGGHAVQVTNTSVTRTQ